MCFLRVAKDMFQTRIVLFIGENSKLLKSFAFPPPCLIGTSVNPNQLRLWTIANFKMTHTKAAINLERLLKKTEALGKDDTSSSNWRLERYVNALNERLLDLQKRKKKPKSEILSEYSRRIEFLKKLVETQKINNSVEKVVALQMMSHGVSIPEGNITREIHQKISAKFNSDIRSELFETDKNDELRQRNLQSGKSTGEDLDALIKYHQSLQGKILGDMLLLTRDLKQQTKLANTLITKDIETLQKSTGLADQNLSRLKIESAKLEEHNRKAWRCWMWVLIFLVMIIFIFMVLFVKVTKK